MTRTQILEELLTVNSAIARARENLNSSNDSVASSAGMRLYTLNAEKKDLEKALEQLKASIVE